MKVKKVLKISIVLIIIVVIAMSVLNSRRLAPGKSSEVSAEREKVNEIRQECFGRVGELMEKDRTQFNEFRSLADFRLHKYRECLREKGVEESF